MRIIGIAFVITLCLLASAVSGADVSLSYRSSTLWSGVNRMIPHDTLLLCAAGSGLMVFSVADLTNPVFLSKLYLERGETVGFQLRGELLYLLENEQKLYVVDISNALSPAIIGSYALGAYGRGFDLVDSLAYVGYFSQSVTDSGGIMVLNVKNPGLITEVGRLTSPDSNFSTGCMKVIGDNAYCSMSGYFSVVDVSDPTNMTRVALLPQDDTLGKWFIPQDIQRGPQESLLAVVDLSLIMPYAYSALSIVNIAQPFSPQLVGRCEFDGATTLVTCADSLAAVSNGRRGIPILDLSNPTHPDTLARYGMNQGTSEFYFTGGVSLRDTILFATDAGLQIDVEYRKALTRNQPIGAAEVAATTPATDLHVVNMADPAHPTRIGGYTLPASVTGVLSGGRYAYALYGGDETANDTSPDIRVVDLINPDTPIVRGSYYTPYRAGDGLLVDTLLYLAVGRLEVIDVVDPDHPALVGAVSTGTACMGLALRGRYLFAACGLSGFKVIDISDPTQPVVLAGIGTRNRAGAVALSGNYAYVGDAYAGLAVIDISDPLHPVLLPYFDDRFIVGNTVIVRDGLLCCDVWGGIVLFDMVTDPAAPQVISICPFPDIQAIAVRDPLVYVANGWDGVEVVDVTDPQTPRISTSTPIPWRAEGVAIDDRFLYVTNEHSLIFYDWTDITDAPGEPPKDLPTQFSLGQNYPNPFNPSTTIAYDLPRRGHVRLTIYNVLGQEVATVVDGEQSVGHHTVPWRGDGFGSGMYFYRLEIDGVTESRKMLLVK